MEKIIIASNNEHKIKEFKEIFSNYEILSLKDIGFFEDIIEDGNSFEENSLIKAKAVSKYLKEKNITANIIADDSGLCVDALDGEPGIYSARYSGEHNDKKNRDKLLENMKNISDRSAKFVCVLVEFFPNNDYIIAKGETIGKITTQEIGDTSFGYDCLFYSTELNKTFGEASSEEKNKISHRGRAIENLIKLANYKH